MSTIGRDILVLGDIQQLLDRALKSEPSVVISAGGVIREGYDEQLDQLRRFATRQASRQRWKRRSDELGHQWPEARLQPCPRLLF